MKSINSLSVVVPCLNEEKSIPFFLDDIRKLRDVSSRLASPIHFRFVFVDNGSTDSSHSLLKTHCVKNSDDLIITCPEVGYGSALKFGFLHCPQIAPANFYGFIDLDDTYEISAFVEMMNQIIFDQKLDIVIANRMTSLSKMPFVRMIGNISYNFVIFLLFGKWLSDSCSGMRVIRPRLVSLLTNTSNNGLGFSIELTCLILLHKFNFKYINTKYKERIGSSKLSVLKDGVDFLGQILKVRLLR